MIDVLIKGWILQIVLLVGTKLQVIITKMGLRIQERGNVVKGIPVVQPGDELFWFGRPRLLLFLIHFILFQVLKNFFCQITSSFLHILHLYVKILFFVHFFWIAECLSTSLFRLGHGKHFYLMHRFLIVCACQLRVPYVLILVANAVFSIHLGSRTASMNALRISSSEFQWGQCHLIQIYLPYTTRKTLQYMEKAAYSSSILLSKIEKKIILRV